MGWKNSGLFWSKSPMCVHSHKKSLFCVWECYKKKRDFWKYWSFELGCCMKKIFLADLVLILCICVTCAKTHTKPVGCDSKVIKHATTNWTNNLVRIRMFRWWKIPCIDDIMNILVGGTCHGCCCCDPGQNCCEKRFLWGGRPSSLKQTKLNKSCGLGFVYLALSMIWSK